MAESYELYMNGERYDEVWMNGLEYTEAWMLVDGVPTKVWGKVVGGVGGFYDASGNLILEWNKIYNVVYQTSSSSPSNNGFYAIPNGVQSYEQAINFNIVYNFESGLYYLMNYITSPQIDVSTFDKLVIPSNLSQIQSRISFDQVRQYSKDNLTSIVFLDGDSELQCSTSEILYSFDNIKYVDLGNRLHDGLATKYILYNVGNKNDEGLTLDLSKSTSLTILPKIFYSHVKKILFPDTITSYNNKSLDYFNNSSSNSIITMEELYLPNCHEYPNYIFYSGVLIDKLEIPPNSKIGKLDGSYYPYVLYYYGDGVYYTDAGVKETIINDNTEICENGIYISGKFAKKLQFNGNNITYNHKCVYYSESSGNSTLNIIFNGTFERFNIGNSTTRLTQCFYTYGKIIFEFPSTLKEIPDYFAYIGFTQTDDINLPYPLERIGFNALDGLNYGNYGSNVLNFINPNNWCIRTKDGDIIKVDSSVASDKAKATEYHVKAGYISSFEWVKNAGNTTIGIFDSNGNCLEDWIELELYCGSSYQSNPNSLYSKKQQYPSLSKIVFPKSSTEIGSYAFADCPIEYEIESVDTIRSNAFQNWTQLTSFSIPSTVIHLVGNPFVGCTNLSSVSFDNSSNWVCQDLGEEINFNDSQYNVELFKGFKSSYYFERLQKGYGFYYDDSSYTWTTSFSGFKSVEESNVEFETNYTSSNYSSSNSASHFLNSSPIKYYSYRRIYLPHVSRIGNYCFYNSKSSFVFFNSSITSIGNYAFASPQGVKIIRIPETVTSIGTNAFKGYTTVYYKGTASGSPWGATNVITDF